jgi:hypothetical protein
MQMVRSRFARVYQVSVAGADYEGRGWKEYMGRRESRWKNEGRCRGVRRQTGFPIKCECSCCNVLPVLYEKSVVVSDYFNFRAFAIRAGC